MENVRAPEGYEGSYWYRDGTRSYVAGYRRVGERFWTLSGDVGPAHLTRDELRRRAEETIALHILIMEAAAREAD